MRTALCFGMQCVDVERVSMKRAKCGGRNAREREKARRITYANDDEKDRDEDGTKRGKLRGGKSKGKGEREREKRRRAEH